MNNIEYLIGAYALIWLVLAYYFYTSGAKLKQLEEKVKILEDEKIDKSCCYVLKKFLCFDTFKLIL